METGPGLCSKRVSKERDNVEKTLAKPVNLRKIECFCLNKSEE